MSGEPILDFAALDAAPVSNDPFRHVVVPHFVSPAALARVYAGLPRMTRGGSFPHEALRMGEEARALMAEMESPKLRGRDRREAGPGAGRCADHADGAAVLPREGRPDPHGFRRQARHHPALPQPRERRLQTRRRAASACSAAPTIWKTYAVEIPPTRGTLLDLPERPHHLARPPHLCGATRHSVQLNYMTNDSKCPVRAAAA